LSCSIHDFSRQIQKHCAAFYISILLISSVH
jgi:hypothetical protein